MRWPDPEPVKRNSRDVGFCGRSPAEVFGKANAWFTSHGDVSEVIYVSWHHRHSSEPYKLVIHYDPR